MKCWRIGTIIRSQYFAPKLAIFIILFLDHVEHCRREPARHDSGSTRQVHSPTLERSTRSGSSEGSAPVQAHVLRAGAAPQWGRCHIS